MKYISLLIVALAVVLLPACDKENEGGENHVLVSKFDSQKSHNVGQNCMNCHVQGGKGEGWFNVAGTVFNESQKSTLANAVIKIYTEDNGKGTLKYTINGDGKGNFYTTETIDFGSGLFIAVEGANETKYMHQKLTTGACNSCHGSSVDKIWTR